MTSQFEREEQQLEDDLNDGLISNREYNSNMRQLQRDCRDDSRQAAEEAYDAEMDKW